MIQGSRLFLCGSARYCSQKQLAKPVTSELFKAVCCGQYGAWHTHTHKHLLEQPRALPDINVIPRTVPVEAQLALPRKFTCVHDGVAHKGVHDVARMHVDDDEGVDLATHLV